MIKLRPLTASEEIAAIDAGDPYPTSIERAMPHPALSWWQKLKAWWKS